MSAFEKLVNSLDYFIDDDNDIIFFKKGDPGWRDPLNWRYLYIGPHSLFQLAEVVRMDKQFPRGERWVPVPKRMRKVLRTVAFPHVLEDPDRAKRS